MPDPADQDQPSVHVTDHPDSIADTIAAADQTAMHPQGTAYATFVVTVSRWRNCADRHLTDALTAVPGVSITTTALPGTLRLRRRRVSVVGRWVNVRTFMDAYDAASADCRR